MKPSVVNQVKAAKRDAGTPQKQFTREEIEKHDKEDDCWIVVDGKVYDATSVMAWHPGGKAPIMAHAGRVHQEATEEFESIHDGFAYEKLTGKMSFAPAFGGVLTLQNACSVLSPTRPRTSSRRMPKRQRPRKPNEKRALQKHKWIPTKLINRKALSEDTFSYTFQPQITRQFWDWELASTS